MQIECTALHVFPNLNSTMFNKTSFYNLAHVATRNNNNAGDLIFLLMFSLGYDCYYYNKLQQKSNRKCQATICFLRITDPVYVVLVAEFYLPENSCSYIHKVII